MAITNDERREVAAKLRECSGLHEFAEIFGFSWNDETDWYWRDVAVKVADLIDPEERAYEPFGIWHEISQTQEIRRRLCGYCGNELGIDKRNHFPFEVEDLCELPNYCPNCGREVVEQ